MWCEQLWPEGPTWSASSDIARDHLAQRINTKKIIKGGVFFENIVSFSLSMKVSLIILEEKKSRKHEKSEKCSKTFHVHSCVWSLPVEEWCSAVKPEIKPNLQYGFFCHLQFTEAWERLRWPEAAGGQETRFCFLRRVSPHTGPGAAGLHHWSSQSPATEQHSNTATLKIMLSNIRSTLVKQQNTVIAVKH